MRRFVLGLVALVAAGVLALLTVPSAQALPLAPKPVPGVPGVPAPCEARHEWPAKSSAESVRQQMEKNFGLQLVGSDWLDARYRPVVKQVWTTLDAVNCVSYLDDIRTKTKSKTITIVAGSTGSWAWADWGLSNAGKLTFDFSKWITALPDDPGRLSRVTIHELGHAFNIDRGSNPAYWTEFSKLYSQHGRFSQYGDNDLETFAEVVGYYVARCAKDNPYDDPAKASANAAYYSFVRTYVFKGVEFGSGLGVKQACAN